MKARDAIIKQNLEFIYGKNKEDVKILDPDKASYIRSEAQPKGYAKDEAIVGFSGEWEALLPVHKCSVFMKGDSLSYPSFEHALHASKFLHADDRNSIRELSEIVDVKRFVSRNKNDTSKLRPNWAEHGLAIAKSLLRDKFMRNRALKITLMKTGHKKLIYQNDFNDQYWGVTPAGKGQNHLGLLLQQIRREIDYGEDIDHWIQDFLVLLHKEDVRMIVDINDPANDTTRRRIAEAKAKEKAAKEAAKNAPNCKGKNNQPVEPVKIDDPNHIQFENKNIVYFGSADFNHVVILDNTASRIHAAVVMGSDRIAYIIDLGSSNGTSIISPSQEKTLVPPFQFVPLAPAATLTVTDSGDVQPSIIRSIVSFGRSTATYEFTIHSNATDLRQSELLQRLNQPQDSENGSHVQQTSENTIFVRNLDPTTSDDEVRDFFASCGSIASLHIPRDRLSQQATRGIAFVTFMDPHSVYQALTLDGDPLKNAYVKIKRSEAQASTIAQHNTQYADSNNRRDQPHNRRINKEDIAKNAMRMSGNSGSSTMKEAGRAVELREESRPTERMREQHYHRRDDSRNRSYNNNNSKESSEPSRRRVRSRSRSMDSERDVRSRRRNSSSRERHDVPKRGRSRDRDHSRDRGNKAPSEKRNDRERSRDRDHSHDKGNKGASEKRNDRERSLDRRGRQRQNSPFRSLSPARKRRRSTSSDSSSSSHSSVNEASR
jgi:ribA/ribD-fused uncharacterized protein